MQTIPTFVDGQMVKAPILTAEHLVAFEKIKNGRISSCPAHLVQDLITIGWVKEGHYGQ